MSAEVRTLEIPSALLASLEREIGLPDVCQEGVRQLQREVRRANRENTWFKLRTPEEFNLTVPQTVLELAQTPEATEAIKLYGPEKGTIVRVSGEEYFFPDSMDAYSDEVEKLVKKLGRNEARTGAINWNWDTALGPLDAAIEIAMDDSAKRKINQGAVAWNVLYNLNKATSSETVRDRRPLNPYSFLVQLYALGAARIDYRQVNSQMKFVVDFPLEVEGRKVLGCFVPGEERIAHYHGWTEDCSEAIPLNHLIDLVNPRTIPPIQHVLKKSLRYRVISKLIPED
jgi:hypothetical protein